MKYIETVFPFQKIRVLLCFSGKLKIFYGILRIEDFESNMLQEVTSLQQHILVPCI